jgi:hypothetical protein
MQARQTYVSDRDRSKGKLLDQEGVMIRQSDEDYYAARAAAERRLSQTASDPRAAGVHEAMAERYEALRASTNVERPVLRIAIG